MLVPSSFSLLMPSESHQYLGYPVKDMKPMFGLITLTPPPNGFPLALSQQLGKKCIRGYQRCCCTPLLRVNQDRNPLGHGCPTIALLNIILHLHTVGFPEHWLSQSLTDILKTTAPTYTGGLPIELSERHRKVKAKAPPVTLDSIFRAHTRRRHSFASRSTI